MKNIFFVLVILFLSKTMFSQINYGIKGGVNYSNTEIIYPLTSEFITAPNEYKIGYHFGLFANIPIAKDFYANTELIFSEKGSISPKTPFAESITYNLKYINIPLLLSYNLFNKLNIQVGIQPGYLVSATANSKSNRFLYKDFSLDYLAGIEYFIHQIGFGLRYEHSLLYISDVEFRNIEGAKIANYGEISKNIQAYISYIF